MALRPARTSQFKKDFKLARKRGWDVEHLTEVMTKLINEEPLGREYGTHMLKGEYKGHSECHVGGDFLLIWYVEDDQITFVRTGNHADLFGK